MSDEGNQIQIHAGSFVTGFFDLLGQQDRLREIREIPSETDAEGLDKLREQIKQSYGFVLGFRNAFTKFFDGFAKSDMDLSALSEAQRAEFEQYTAHDVRLQPMSDSVLAYTPAFGPSGKISFKGIFGLIGAATGSMLTCLAAGFPLRGGIDLGLSLVVDDTEFYGPALARAYVLESKIARYPRVVVGNELVRFLQEYASSEKEELEHKMAKAVASACLELCAVDIDGNTFLDFLGPGSKKHLGHDIESAVIATAIQNVFSAQEQFKSEGKQELAFRYALLGDYCRERAPIWGVKVE